MVSYSLYSVNGYDLPAFGRYPKIAAVYISPILDCNLQFKEHVTQCTRKAHATL